MTGANKIAWQQMGEIRLAEGQFAPSLQGIGYGQSNPVTGRGSLSDPNGKD